jgi:serum/glucocorticoid-regulated kinase 2
MRLLLANAANVNASYHSLAGHGPGEYDNFDTAVPAGFSCGKVVQLAAEKGHSEVVQLLLDNGAEVTLPRMTLPGPHTCRLVPRATYLRVAADLEAAAAARKED